MTHKPPNRHENQRRPMSAKTRRLLKYYEQALRLRCSKRTVSNYLHDVSEFLAWVHERGLELPPRSSLPGYRDVPERASCFPEKRRKTVLHRQSAQPSERHQECLPLPLPARLRAERPHDPARVSPEGASFWRGFTSEASSSLPEVRSQDIETYQNALLAFRKKDGKPYSIGNQHNRLSAIKSVFRFLYQRGYVLSDPTTRLEYHLKEVRLPRTILTAHRKRNEKASRCGGEGQLTSRPSRPGHPRAPLCHRLESDRARQSHAVGCERRG